MSKLDDTNSDLPSRSKKNKKSKKKRLLYILVPLALIIFTVTAYGTHLYVTAQSTVNGSYEGVGRDDEKSDLRDGTVNPVDDNVSILIIGVDESEKRGYKEASRSDALLLATFNKADNDVKLLSIPRDSYVYVPEVDNYTKVTHAHAYGGPKATIETVENFLNVPVDYYVRLDFEAFIDVIDSLGGINYNVPFEMKELNSKDKLEAIHLMPGYQKLEGEEALALVRTRKYDSDIERGERQQKIIKTVAKEAASASSVLKLDNLIEAIGSNMKTNISFKDMRSFISYGLNNKVRISSINLDGDGRKLDDGIWYYNVYEDSRVAVENELREHLNLPIINKYETESEFSAEEDRINPFPEH